MEDKVCGADYSSGWGLEKSYILGLWTDEIVCFVDRTADSDPPPRYYFTKDRLNSTRELINASATVMTRYDYDVWSVTSEAHLVGSVSTRYRAGGLEDLAEGMYAKPKTMYDPSVGREVKGNFNYTMVFPDGGRYEGPGRALGPAMVEPRLCTNVPVAYGHDPPPEGYCEMWWRECTARCESTGACHANWHKALCYRCCRCYYKRCWNGCGETGANRGLELGKDYLYGPPDTCRSHMSRRVCPKACFAYNYYPPLVHPDTPDRCDSEGKPHRWDNICASAKYVYDEYGVSVRWTGASMPGEGLSGVSFGCKRCAYEGVGYWEYRPVTLAGFSVSVHRTREACPAWFPKWLSPYWPDRAMWNSCHEPWAEPAAQTRPIETVVRWWTAFAL